MLLEIPVAPDPDQARQLLLDELAKPEYEQAKPSWFDQLMSGFFGWLDSLLQPTGTPVDAIGPVVLVLVVAAVIVAALLLFGRPRLRRAVRRQTASVFGDDDRRSATELRESARRAHASGDDTLAVEELFRALARRLDERGLVDAAPGMTAQDFANRAGRAFPDAVAGLGTAAARFDDVRYLERPGNATMYDEVDAITSALWDRRPAPLQPATTGARS